MCGLEMPTDEEVVWDMAVVVEVVAGWLVVAGEKREHEMCVMWLFFFLVVNDRIQRCHGDLICTLSPDTSEPRGGDDGGTNLPSGVMDRYERKRLGPGSSVGSWAGGVFSATTFLPLAEINRARRKDTIALGMLANCQQTVAEAGNRGWFSNVGLVSCQASFNKQADGRLRLKLWLLC